jgi:phage tail sheath protein FI
MGIVKTPGVYILDKGAFPNSIVEVATAVPAFVGWTERADDKGSSLHLKPWRITSMAEYQQCFGGAPTAEHVRFRLAKMTGAGSLGDPDEALCTRDATPLRLGTSQYTITQTGGRYLLYYAMQLFFRNGGGPCYVVSAGEYGGQVDAAPLAAGVEELVKEIEPTMLVIPEAVLLKQKDCLTLQVQMLQHCGQVMKNRVAILDIWEGYRPRSDSPDVVAAFRDGVGPNDLAFGAAYYPWVNTTVVQESEIGYRNLTPDESLDTLITCIKDEIAAAGIQGVKKAAMEAEVDRIKTVTDPVEKTRLSESLLRISPFLNAILTEMARRLNLLPPSAAMAGIYTMVDAARGVWKAPANVSLSSVVSPATPLSHEQQEDLNVTPQGKSINALRSFVGEGTLVWGARTLDGTSLDWRYIHVRRTMIMLEESIRLAVKTMVFEPNATGTWVTIKGMISNFLTGIWKRGGLAGAVPEDAFSVHVGLGETMTAEDTLEGILRVTVLVAISRPAEFIEITFQQQMQKS